MKNASIVKLWAGNIALAAVCFAAGRLSMLMALIEKETLIPTTPLWLPMGIGVGGMLLLGYRCWPGVWIGQLAVSLTTGVPPVLAASVATGSIAAMLVSVFLLKRSSRFDPRLGRIDAVVVFLLVAVLLGPALSATFGISMLSVSGIIEWQKSGEVWWVFWIGDAVGVLVLAPFILIWGIRHRPASFSKSPAEAIICGAALGLLCAAIAAETYTGLLSGIVAYSFFPFIVWAALRFQQHGAVTATLVIAGFLLWQASHGSGALEKKALVSTILELDGFFILIATTGLLIAASSSEHARALLEVLEREKDYRDIFSIMIKGVVYQDAGGNIILANPAAQEILGQTTNQMKNSPPGAAFGAFVNANGDEIPAGEHPSILALESGLPVMDKVLGVFNPVRKERVWVNISAVPQFREGESKPYQIITTLEDITERETRASLLELHAARYLKAQEMGKVGNWEYDIAAEAFWGSREAKRMFGLDPDSDAHSVEAVESVIADRDRVHRALEELVEQGKPYDIEYEIFPGDKEKRRVIHSIAELVKDGSGKPEKIIGVVKDVTRSKALESELINSREKLRRLAAYLQKLREEDRIAIAREIHDDLGQTLSALKMDLGWLRKRLSPGQEKAADKITEMKTLIDQSVLSVKRLCSELRPGILDDLGLVEALKWLAQQFAERSGIRCHLAIEPQELMLDQELSTTIYRIAQESLTNVSRHSQAQNVWISLEERPGSLALRIRDDGKNAYDSRTDGAQSFGVIGMRERAYSHDGSFEISGEEGKGTLVVANFPLTIDKSVA